MKTPIKLISALRQYRHNNNWGDELVKGFDYEETVKIFTQVQREKVDMLAAIKEARETEQEWVFLEWLDNYLDYEK